MKILIINPNSDPEMTKAIQTSAEDFAGGNYDVKTLLTPGAPRFIETYEDKIKAAPGMIRLIRDNEEKYDAFINACHCDPNHDAMKEVTGKPVVGIGEASMKIATMLGHSFSVVSTAKHSIPNKETLIKQYGLQNSLASVRAPEEEDTSRKLEDIFMETSRAAVEEDMAEVIVLGCAGLTGLDKSIQKKLGIPVLDGVICALIIAEGLVRYRVSTSKIRRYNPDY